MASAKDLRKRIASVRNTQQITRAMKMVSAAKLRRAQEAIVSLRPYAQGLNGIVQRLCASNLDEKRHPLMEGRGEIERVLLVVVTSDRGLCGGFNASVIKAAVRYSRTHAHKYRKFDLAFIGKKGYEFFKQRSTPMAKYYQNFFAGVNYAKSRGLSEELVQAYLNGEYDEIRFVYSEFRSAISQKVQVETLLPLRAPEDVEQQGSGESLFEPSRREIMDHLLPKHFATQIHRILLESLASEHGARMSAMENATKNAGEMIYKLNLEYNKSRQAGITKELLEIVAGSEAQKV